MNKKSIVTKENITRVAKFLKESCEHFKKDGDGCCGFKLSNDLALYVGWSDGYNMADTDIIKSKEGQRQNGSWTCGYAVNAAVKVRNDSDCADFDFLDYPFYEDGECWDTGISMKPDITDREYRKYARWFLGNFVEITNAHNKGELKYE
jgi:hypothetical protein